MKVYHSSESDTWLTPRSVVDRLGRVALDPCSHPRSLVPAELRAMGPDVDGVDGLDLPWHEADGLVFVNPPYSKLRDWLRKCAEAAALGASVLALCPARIDTIAFHEHVLPSARVLAISGRLRFAATVEDLTRAHAKKPSDRLARQIAACVDGVCHETDSAPFPAVMCAWNLPPHIETALADLGIWIGQ